MQRSLNRAANAASLFVAAVVIAYAQPISLHAAADNKQAQSWLIATAENASPVEQANVELLRKRLRSVSGTEVDAKPLASLTAEERANHDLIIAGSVSASPKIAEIVAERKLDSHFASKPEFVQEQGYVVATDANPDAPDRQLILALGKQELGATFAMAHLGTRLINQDSGIAVAFDDATSLASDESSVQFHAPDRPVRGIYYNIAYGFTADGITPETWDEDQWRAKLAELKSMRLTHVFFFLWGNGELYHPKSPVSATERNRVVHERLRFLIDEAHRLGMKVSFMMTTTMIPDDIFKANPQIKAEIVYVDHGFSCINPSSTESVKFGEYEWANVWELMHDLFDNELAQFKELDELQHCFYDPGGSFDPVSKANQADVLMRQVREFTEVARKLNPDMKYSVNFWPVWALEKEYKVSYRDKFLDQLKEYYASESDPNVIVYDSIDEPDTSLKQAHARGIPVGGFIFPTNVESGYPFATPLIGYLSKVLNIDYGDFTSQDLYGTYFMRIEDGTKVPNSWFASETMWNGKATPTELTHSYGLWAAGGNPAAAEKFADAMATLESFTTLGADQQDMAAQGKRIETLINEGLAELPQGDRARLEWLDTTGKLMRILGEGAEDFGNEKQLTKLEVEFRDTLLASPLMKSLVHPGGGTHFRRNAEQLKKGWNAEHF
jgi:hypothetical protein